MTTDNRTIINDCNAVTGWTGDDAVQTVAISGLFYQGGISLGTQLTDADEQMHTTEDSVSTGTFSLDWSDTTLYAVTKTNLNDTLVNGGGKLVIGDAVDLLGYEVFGSDERGITLDAFFFGNKLDIANRLAVTSFAYAGSEGALAVTGITRVGWGSVHLSKAQGPSDNVYMDVFRYIANSTPGRAGHNPVLTVDGGTSGTPETMTDLSGDDITNGWGVVSNVGGSAFQIFCPLQFGATAAADTYFRGVDEQWTLLGFQQGEHHFDHTIVTSSANTHSVDLLRVVIVQIGTRSKLMFDPLTTITNLLTKFDSVTFDGVGEIYFSTQDVGDRFASASTFNDCGVIFPNTMDIDDCVVNSSDNINGAISLAQMVSSSMTAWVFNADTTLDNKGHAIQAWNARSYDADNWTFNDYSAVGGDEFDTGTDVDGGNDEIDLPTHAFETGDPVVITPTYVTPALPQDIGLPFQYFDDFNRGDETLNTATAWQALAAIASVEVVSNQITGDGTVATASELNSSVLDTADQAIEATVVTLSATASDWFEIAVRTGGGTANYYSVRVLDDGAYSIERIGTGATTLLSRTGEAGTVVANDRIRLEVSDNADSDPELIFYINGKHECTVVDTTASPFATGACAVLFSAGNDEGDLDNVVIEDLDLIVWARDVAAGAISLHTTKAGADADTGQIVLTSGGSDTHTVYSAEAIFFNRSGGAVTYAVLNSGDTPSVRNGAGATTTVDNNVTVESNGMTEGAAVKLVARETVGTITLGDVLDERLADSSGEAIFTINYEAAFDPSGLDVIVRAAHNGLPNAAVAEDSGFTDETTAANSSTDDDMTLTPNNPQDVGNAYYLGHSEQFTTGPNGTIRLKLEVTQAHGAGNPTIVWEFWDGLAWSALTFTDTDPNPNFASVGEFIYEFDAEGSWATTTVNAQGPFYFVRARVSVAGTSTNGARGRFSTLDVTKFFRQDLNRIIASDGLITTVPWNINSIAKFDPAND